MLIGITILLIFQLLGEMIAFFIGGVIPGPVIGMALIALALSLTKGRVRLRTTQNHVIASSNILLANLGLLFVPAGVGIIRHLDLLAQRGIALLAIIAGSTLITMSVTVWVFIAAKRMIGRGGNHV